MDMFYFITEGLVSITGHKTMKPFLILPQYSFVGDFQILFDLKSMFSCKVYQPQENQELTLEMSQDVYSVLFGFTKSEETTANNNTENAKEKMVEIVVENHEAIDGMQQFELIIPETDNLNFTPIKIDDTYETSSKSYYVS